MAADSNIGRPSSNEALPPPPVMAKNRRSSITFLPSHQNTRNHGSGSLSFVILFIGNVAHCRHLIHWVKTIVCTERGIDIPGLESTLDTHTSARNRLSAKKKDPPGLTKRRLYQLQHLAKVTLKRLHADSYSSNILQRKKPKASSSMPHLILLFSSCFTFLDYKTVAKINTFFKHCTLLIKMCRTKQQILCKHIRLINNRRAAKVVT